MEDHVQLKSSHKVAGRIHVQLFGEDGEVVHEETKDNYISPYWLQIVAEWANFAAFQPYSSTTGTPTDNTFIGQNNSILATVPFTGIMLTSHDGPVRPEDLIPKGDVVAFGQKDQPPSGDKWGNYNAVESIHHFNYHKFVYDFASNQANETFQSIYSGDFRPSSVVTGGVPAAAERYLIRSSATQDSLKGNWRMHNGVITVGGHINPVTVLRKVNPVDVFTYAARQSTIPFEEVPILSPGGFTSHEYRGERLYWLAPMTGSGTSRAQRIYSAPVSDTDNYREEHTITAADMTSMGWTSNSASLLGLAYRADRDTFIIGNHNSQSTGPSAAFYEFSATTWELENAYDGEISYRNGYVSAHPGDPDALFIGGQAASGIQRSNYLEIRETPAEVRPGPIMYADIYGIVKDMLVVHTDSSNYFRPALGPVSQFFSRVLLDEPVTKTSVNTMKISYEFTFPEPDLW